MITRAPSLLFLRLTQAHQSPQRIVILLRLAELALDRSVEGGWTSNSDLLKQTGFTIVSLSNCISALRRDGLIATDYPKGKGTGAKNRHRLTSAGWSLIKTAMPSA